jgi:hypothetical protein
MENWESFDASIIYLINQIMWLIRLTILGITSHFFAEKRPRLEVIDTIGRLV